MPFALVDISLYKWKVLAHKTLNVYGVVIMIICLLLKSIFRKKNTLPKIVKKGKSNKKQYRDKIPTYSK